MTKTFIALFLGVFVMSCTTLVPNRTESNSFSAQKGKLVWPSEGTISDGFGTVTNPVYGTKTHNPGIVISTVPEAAVRSVFEGEVTDVYVLPEFGRIVAVRHGDYTSLYGNLSSLFVEEGMSVSAGQIIGLSGTENEPKGPAVFFGLFQKGVETNPEPWLRRS